MSNAIGYLGPDMNGQNVQSQFDQLNAAGVTKIICEQYSALKRDRPLLDKLMAGVRQGDAVVVTSLYRIAYSTKHLLEIVESLNAAGASLKVIDSNIDTSTPHGEVMRLLLSAIFDFERQMVRENQAVGIASAKREGRYKGRKPTARAKADEVLTLSARGLTRQKVADELGIGIASVYRILKNHATSQKMIKKPRKKPVDKQKLGESNPARKADAEQLSLF